MCNTHERLGYAQEVFRDILNKCQHHKRYEECDDDVLVIPLERYSVQPEVKRDLRDDGEHQKPQGVFFDIACSDESFHEEETEYRKCKTSDAAACLVKGVERFVLFGKYIHGMDYHVVVDDTVPAVVYEHKNTCKRFKHIA